MCSNSALHVFKMRWMNWPNSCEPTGRFATEKEARLQSRNEKLCNGGLIGVISAAAYWGQGALGGGRVGSGERSEAGEVSGRHAHLGAQQVVVAHELGVQQVTHVIQV